MVVEETSAMIKSLNSQHYSNAPHLDSILLGAIQFPALKSITQCILRLGHPMIQKPQGAPICWIFLQQGQPLHGNHSKKISLLRVLLKLILMLKPPLLEMDALLESTLLDQIVGILL